MTLENVPWILLMRYFQRGNPMKTWILLFLEEYLEGISQALDVWKKKDQNMISHDTIDDIPISQDNKCKCKGINLFDVSKNEVSSISVVKKGFRHLVTEALRHFASYISTSLDWPFGEAKGVLFDMKST